jgi:hypothetical protein
LSDTWLLLSQQWAKLADEAAAAPRLQRTDAKLVKLVEHLQEELVERALSLSAGRLAAAAEATRLAS